MMKKIIALLLALMLIFSLTAALSACGEDEPVVEDPTTEDPTTEDPKTEDPTTEDPTTEDPKTEDPTTDEPQVPEEDPTTDDPTTEEPTEDVPTEDVPTEDVPTEDVPTENVPTEEPTEDEPTVEDPPLDVNRDVVLIKGGKASFKFVIASGYTSDVTRATDALISDLAKFGVITEKAFDSADNISDCEVLIGAVKTRGEAYAEDYHVYGYKGYAIKAINGKVLITAGSEESLLEAIEEFKKEILGITKKTKVLTDVTMTVEQSIEIIQDDYSIESISFAGNDIKNYVIAARIDASAEIGAARDVQDLLYKKAGIWLEIVEPEAAEGLRIELNLSNAKECKSTKGFILEIIDGSVLIDCGFANKISEATLAFFMTEITNSKNKNPSFPNNYKYEKVDYKNIYYKDYGAKGDGYTDDFFAIMACHEEANLYGHTVNAESGAKYYFGKGSGYSTITIQTDTNWNGCEFIFDDSKIKAPPYDANTGLPTGESGDPEYYTSIFSVSNSNQTVYYNVDLPITSLYEGATNVGFAPGYEALIIPYNANVYHFIRYGGNKDNGSAQHEVIHVDAEGNIDPETPVQWSYSSITSLTVIPAEEDPITINGGDSKRAHITTDFNNAPSYYTYYNRNISITRSNVTLKNITHEIINEGETGAPYISFISITDANNIVIDNCELQCPKIYYTEGSGGGKVSMGSYELGAATSTNVTWQNCTQSNLYKEDGSMQTNGMVGTNYCKNITYINMQVCSFDAHCGTYNATLIDSTCEHINFIGEGTIYLENVTILANPAGSGLVLRSDYGSTWQGDLIIKGLNMKYYTRNDFTLIDARWTNHFFGYQTYLPTNIWLENVRITKIDWEIDDQGNRIEWEIPVEQMYPLKLYSHLQEYTNIDISNPNADCSIYPTDDIISCQCESGFNDTTGDGLCDNAKCGMPKDADYTKNMNPFITTKKLYIKDCPGLTLKLPKIPAFKLMEVFVYSEEVEDYLGFDWWQSGEVSFPK